MKHILFVLLCCSILLGFTEHLQAKPQKKDPPQNKSQGQGQSKGQGTGRKMSGDSERGGPERQAADTSGRGGSAAGAAYFYASNAFRVRKIFPDGTLLLVSEVQAYDWTLEQYYDVQEKVELIGVRPPKSQELCYQEFLDRLKQLSAGRLYLEHETSVQPSEADLQPAYLWTGNGLLINLQLVREGYAAALALSKHKYQIDFLAEQDLAQGQQRGIWGSQERCTAVPLPLVYSSNSPVKAQADEKAGCKIKGLIGSDGKLKYCLSPGDRNYDAISVRSAKGERWFCSKEDARKVGWPCY